jgi:hypothetical protein
VSGGNGYGPYDASVPGPGSPCTRPTDCGGGLTCGADGACHAGDCGTSGCPSGYVCKLSGGALACVATSTPPDAGKPDTNPPFNGCNDDADCPSPAGSRCLDGACVAPANQCSDGTQCAAGSQCVQGACTPTCDSNAQCPKGYSCDQSKGVCTGNTTPCGAAADGGGTCPSGTTCSQDHCVAPCGANGTCSGTLVCVDGGCVPNEQPQFTCANEGTQDACASGSVCLHHSCYIACDQDAGATACKSADKFNVCKSVQTSSGSYSVCGSSSNLGTDCDPTQGKGCADGKICIDGFCR